MQVNGGVVSFLGCDLDDNYADEAGGALYVGGGSVLLANRTLLRGNSAPVGALVHIDNPQYQGTGSVPYGLDAGTSGRHPSGPTLAYGLPAPLGYWVPEPFLCDEFTATQWDARREGHRCDYAANPHVRGLWVSPFAYRPVEVDPYPFACPAGTIGNSSEPQDQATPLCDGYCPQGTYCGGGGVGMRGVGVTQVAECRHDRGAPTHRTRADLSRTGDRVPGRLLLPAGMPACRATCRAMRCDAMPCHAMPCHAIPCHPMPLHMLRFGAQGSAMPTPCPPGTYGFQSSGLSYAPLDRLDQCWVCPSGRMCPAATGRSPPQCGSGSYAAGGASACEGCAAGSYQRHPLKASCDACGRALEPRQQHSPRCRCAACPVDATLCRCPGGFFCPERTADPIECGAGTFANGSSASCYRCAAGEYQAAPIA